MDLNIELFRRISPDKKLEMIKKATQSELLSLSRLSIERMVKEAGTRINPAHVAKELHIDSDMANNRHNSNINCIFQGRKRNSLYFNVYLQGYDIDTEESCEYDNFANSEDLCKFKETYLYGGYNIIHAKYCPEDKARVLKAICIAYIENKYKDKLNKDE